MRYQFIYKFIIHFLFKTEINMKKLLLTSWFIVLAVAVFAQEDRYVPETDPQVLQKLEHWQDVKFGLLMHWGAYSQWGIVESWSICSEDEPWCRRKIDNYTEYKKEYEGLKNTFNPTKFNPEKWAEAAKEAGMKYVVFTTKHHDGFCMFDTKYTDYKITGDGCPFHTNPKANVTKEIFDAFRKEGFMIGAYFSKPDWHSPDYWNPQFATPDRNVNYIIAKHPDWWASFVQYTHSQINELMTNYGQIDILWLDGGWVQPMTDEQLLRIRTSRHYTGNNVQSQDIDMAGIVHDSREKQPGLIVVDRAVQGKFQNYLTPEARVPDKTLPYPWETCMPMATSWSYVPNDKYKSANELVHMLIDVVSKGGNLLLNIGPSELGEFAPDAYDRLHQIGEWMKINSEAIYSTKPIAPYKEGKICMTQKNDGTVYLLYLADQNETKVPSEILLTSIKPAKNATISLLGTSTKLNWKYSGTGFYATIPENIQKNPPCENAWVFKVSKVME